MRAKFVNADGGWQYREIHRLDLEIYFQIFPHIKFGVQESDCSVAITVKKRTFELRFRNENGIPVYFEVVE